MNNASIKTLGRVLLPVGVFCLAYGLHYLWFSTHPEPLKLPQDICEDGCNLPSMWDRYIQTQNYLLGYSCALGFAFAADALRRYIELHSTSARNMAAGSAGITALFCGGACFLFGCCGSPMLGVWLTLFGANVLPMAKPIAAGVATIAVAIAAWWSYRKQAQPCCAPGASCQSTTTTAT
ncbi:MAG: hypothetical protein K2X27_01010 [Candidatus Obscuribacterales bacterium]|nr:hypothetical protein [Candidatus Obscuribacterales bacterium]